MIDTKALRQKVLDLAIRGKLVPQDPNDEPASVLLERIRAQKQQMVKEGKLKAKDIKNDTIIFVGEDNLHYEKFADGSVKCIEDEIPFDLPKGWAWDRLSNIAVFSGGKTPSTAVEAFWGNEVLWVTSKDMKSKYIDSSIMRLSKLGAEQLQIYPIGTILLVVRSGILRHTLPVSILKTPATVNQDLKAISFYCGNLAEYVYCCFKGMENTILHTYTKAGATVENINFDAFQKILLPFAPERQMPQIVASVQIADELIGLVDEDSAALVEDVSQAKSKILDLAIRGQLVPQDSNDEPASVLLERIRAEKEELIKAGKIKRDKKESVIFKGEDNSYYEKIGNTTTCIDEEIPFDLPDSWCWCRLGSIFKHNTGKALNSANTEGMPLTYITTSNVYWDRFELGNLKSMPFTEDEIEKCTVEKGDLLICEGGDIGRAAIWPYSETVRIQNHIHRLRAYGKINAKLYYYVFFLYKQNGLINGNGIGLQGLSSNQLHNILVPLPPLSEQQKIVDMISKVFSGLEHIEASLS